MSQFDSTFEKEALSRVGKGILRGALMGGLPSAGAGAMGGYLSSDEHGGRNALIGGVGAGLLGAGIGGAAGMRSAKKSIAEQLERIRHRMPFAHSSMSRNHAVKNSKDVMDEITKLDAQKANDMASIIKHRGEFAEAEDALSRLEKQQATAPRTIDNLSEFNYHMKARAADSNPVFKRQLRMHGIEDSVDANNPTGPYVNLREQFIQQGLDRAIENLDNRIIDANDFSRNAQGILGKATKSYENSSKAQIGQQNILSQRSDTARQTVFGHYPAKIQARLKKLGL